MATQTLTSDDIPISWEMHNAQAELARRRKQAGIRAGIASERPSGDWLSSLRQELEPPEKPPEKQNAADTAAQLPAVKMYPGMAALGHEKGLDPVLVVYHLNLALDVAGRGILPVDLVRERLTDKGSNLFVFGRRRLRQILNDGEGIAWTRYKDLDGRVMLKRRSPARLIGALGGGRLYGRPVLLPLSAFTSGMHVYRATVLAAFLAGRKHNNRPISQAAIRQATGFSERAQRTYHQTAKIKTRRNIALGGRADKEGYQEEAWAAGPVVYVHKDHKGKYGRKGAEYLARNLPNSYETKLEKRPYGRQRKINEVVGLVHSGTRGENSGGGDDLVRRRYFDLKSEVLEVIRKATGSLYFKAKPSAARRLPQTGFWRGVDGVISCQF